MPDSIYTVLDVAFEERRNSGSYPLSYDDKMLIGKFVAEGFDISFSDAEALDWLDIGCDMAFIGDTLGMLHEVHRERYENDGRFFWILRMSFDITSARRYEVEYPDEATRVHTLLIAPFLGDHAVDRVKLGMLLDAVKLLGYRQTRDLLHSGVHISTLAKAAAEGVDSSLIFSMTE